MGEFVSDNSDAFDLAEGLEVLSDFLFVSDVRKISHEKSCLEIDLFVIGLGESQMSSIKYQILLILKSFFNFFFGLKNYKSNGTFDTFGKLFA